MDRYKNEVVVDTKGDTERVLAGVEIMIVVALAALAFLVYTVDQTEHAVVTQLAGRCG